MYTKQCFQPPAPSQIMSMRLARGIQRATWNVVGYWGWLVGWLVGVLLGIAESLHQESKIQKVQSVPYLAYQVAYNNLVGSASIV